MGDFLDSEDYTIGWVCALPIEFTAAVAVLDKTHPPLPQNERDDNIYEFGQIGQYNIVITCLPSGVYGTISAAIVATKMRLSFPSITAGLMVGIGGGAPNIPLNDIRLGDVVVSEPVPGFGGVLHYDFGKTVQEGRFVQTGVVNKPPSVFLKTIAKIKAQYLHHNDRIVDSVTTILGNESVPGQFTRPPVDTDRLFQADYDHPPENESCDQCDSSMVIKRPPRLQDQLCIHYGLIASGNQVMKHGLTRDKLSQEKGVQVLCFEMEAAGLMDELPSLVIRGICDYSDSHKNKIWQPYAALTAAAFAKELILQLPPRGSNKGGRAPEIKLSLPTAVGATFGSYMDQHEPECLPGTRTDLLNRLIQWAEDPEGKCMFWLNGMAGTGKSTISRTISRYFQENEQLGATFFFKKGEGDRGSGALFFTTIAVQLARHFRSMALSIKQAIEIDSTISRRALKDQFDKFIVQPLSEVNATHRARLIVVIDALDECEPKEDIRVIISLLSQLKSSKTVDLRVLLTSRPELPIRLGFNKISGAYQDLILHEVPEIEHDISLFLRHELSKIRDEHSTPLEDDWPGEGVIQKLVEMAVPLFIYAATLCRFIGDEYWDPEERLKTVIESRINWQASRLEKIYLPILNQLVNNQDGAERELLIEEFRLIVGTIINLASPMSIPCLASLLFVRESIIESRLKSLHSVLDVPPDRNAPVRIFHLSFRDFLVDSTLQNPFWVDEKGLHRTIASKCMQLMAGSLREDICGVRSPGVLRSQIDQGLVDEHIPPVLAYACRYWIYHLTKGEYHLANSSGEVQRFLQLHLLHWLEAMSLLGNVAEAVSAINALASIADSKNGRMVSEIIYDAKRFILQNQYVISIAPLQTYASAIVFSPSGCIVRKISNPEKIQWLNQLPSVQKEWNALLQTLEGHMGSIRAVAFSPNGKILATASDEMVWMWDAGTGVLMQTLDAHETPVNDVLFSIDSKVLISSSDKIRLWDTGTGALIHALDKHAGWYENLAISPNGKVLASGFVDVVALWDIEDGELIRTLEDYSGSVRSVEFSPNGKILASGDNERIILRDAATGAILQVLEGHTESINAISFSSNSKILASASIDKTIKLWDMGTRTLIQTLASLKSGPSKLVFSPYPGSAILASACGDWIDLWDASTKKLTRTITGCASRPTALAFSPDGSILASGLEDRTVKLWDVKWKASATTSDGARGPVTDVVFSPDGKVLASISNSPIVKLWNTSLGVLVRQLRGHTRRVNAIAFSPNGRVLASGSNDGTVRLWNAGTGTLMRTLSGTESWISAVAFSPDGRALASGTGDREIELWETDTGRAVKTFITRETPLSLSFSKDGRHLNSDGRSIFIASSVRGFHGSKDPRSHQGCETLNSADMEENITVGIQDNEWVVRGTEALLWLPQDRRPVCYAIYNNLVAIGNATGDVSFIGIRSES
ncbi:hypothetical protein ABW19_dt0204807 [Dactylella cylindrospora]|nr:hypothetical protein ABW19_dt0204807 [Dactylella cylindrospora]